MTGPRLRVEEPEPGHRLPLRPGIFKAGHNTPLPSYCTCEGVDNGMQEGRMGECGLKRDK
jgi:hypothetical protein